MKGRMIKWEERWNKKGIKEGGMGKNKELMKGKKKGKENGRKK